MENFIMRTLKQYDLCTFEPWQGKPYIVPDLEPGDEVTLLEDEHYDWENGIYCLGFDSEGDVIKPYIPLCCLKLKTPAEERKDLYGIMNYPGLDFLRIFKQDTPTDINASYNDEHLIGKVSHRCIIGWAEPVKIANEGIGDISSKDIARLRLQALVAKLNEELYKQHLNYDD